MNFLPYLPFFKTYLYKKYPIEITFFVTSRCNYRCKHCFYWQKLNTTNAMSLIEIGQLTKTIPRLLRLLISGGEPYLRSDLPEICQSFYRDTKVLHITIPTNASLPEKIESSTRRILKYCPNSYINVSLSLDALGSKRDEFVGVSGSFQKFEETCNRLQSLKKEYKNLAVGVITTMCKDNQEDLVEIYEYATKNLMVDNFGFNVVRGEPRSTEVKDIDINCFKALTERIVKDDRGKMDFPLFNVFENKRKILYELFYKTYIENKYQIPCYSGRIRGVIDEVGCIFPCEMYMHTKHDYCFGSLRDHNYNFKLVWNSDWANQVRRVIKYNKCFCTHECDMGINVMFNIKFIPKLIRS